MQCMEPASCLSADARSLHAGGQMLWGDASFAAHHVLHCTQAGGQLHAKLLDLPPCLVALTGPLSRGP